MKRFSSNITDEELYCLFREAAEQYNPKLNDSERLGAWESIANSLLAGPGRNRTSSNKWRKRCLALLMVWLLTGGLAIFRIIQLQESNEQYALEAARSKLELHPPTNTILLSTVPASSKIKTNQKKTPAEPAAMQRNAGRNTATVPAYNDANPGYNDVSAANDDVSAAFDDDNPAHTGVKKKKVPDNCFNNNNSHTSINPHTSIDPDSTTKPDQPIAATDTVATSPEQAQQPPQEKPSKQKKKTPPIRKWQIGLATGLEWNQVKDSRNGKSGQSWGLTLQYRFAPRWSVETGILVVPKLYTTKEWNYGTLSIFQELKSVDGECRTIDVPLNIRYDIIQKTKGRLFGSAGISSYFMQKEDYTFNLEEMGAPVTAYKTVYNKNRHLFSIVNISAGYERNWNRISVQAAPYLKLPLKPIGEGNIDLVGAGLQLSVKYSY